MCANGHDIARARRAMGARASQRAFTPVCARACVIHAPNARARRLENECTSSRRASVCVRARGSAVRALKGRQALKLRLSTRRRRFSRARL